MLLDDAPRGGKAMFVPCFFVLRYGSEGTRADLVRHADAGVDHLHDRRVVQEACA